MLETDRLILRKWNEKDADSLYEYAKDPDVGPIAGWPPHKSREESLDVIRNVFNGAECYAICEKGTDKAIGAIELKLNGHTDMTDKDDECELGYWLGKPFWGRGYMPEAARRIIRHGFEDLGNDNHLGADTMMAIRNPKEYRKKSDFAIIIHMKKFQCL